MSNSSRRISDRVLAVILSVLLMVGMLPTSVFAAVPGTHEGVFTFTVTDGENPIDGAEVTYTVTTASDGEAPATSAEEKASTGTDGVAEITTNLPETLESDVTVTVNYTVKASGYTDVTSTHTVASLSDNVAVTMTAIPTVDVTATVVGKGAITVGGTTVDAENIAKVAEGTVNTIVVTPATGYEISSLSIGGIAVVINEINKGGYTDTTYQFDAATEIEVTFVDIQAPVISLVEAAPNGWTNTDKTVTVTASDNSGSFTVYYYYTADGESAAQEAENGSFTAERLGNYTVYAVDIANNKCAEQTIDVTQVDKDAPVVDTITGNPSVWALSATVSGTVSDNTNGSGVSKVVFGTTDAFDDATDTGVTFDAVGGTYSFAVNTNGTYYVWAIDASGNHSEAKSIEITKIDNTDPTISVTANPDNWTNGTIKVEIEAGDAQSNVTVKYSDVAVGDAGATDATQEDDKWTFNIDKDIDGTYTYYVWALDEVGHQESAEVTVYYDGTPPIVAITPLTSTDWTNQDVTITGTVDGVTESTTVSGLDKVVYGTDNDPQNATGVATVEGLNYRFTVTTNGTYNVWSLDKAGNYSDVATIEINNIDKTAPTVDSINVQQGFWPWERNDVTVSGTVSDLGGSNVVKVVYSDSNTFASNLPAATLNSDGTYSFVISKRDFKGYYYVWAIDAAGNITVQPKQAELNMDITLPTIQWVTANPNVWTNTNVIVTISASDNREISKVVYSTSSTYADTHTAATDNMNGTYSFTVPNTDEYNGKYYIWAVDQAGNVSTVADVQIQIDVTKPTTSDPVADPSTWTNTDVTITGTATDTGGSGISKVVYSTENRYNADLPEATLDRDTGEYSIVVPKEPEFNGNYYIWVVDGAGNVSDAKSVSVQIDTTKPTASIAIDEKTWDKLIEFLTFGLYKNTDLEVTITAADNESEIANSGVAKIEYYKVTGEAANNLLDETALAALEASAWTEYSPFVVSTDEVFVVYAKVTDRAGNVGYFCSEKAVRDTVAPQAKIEFDANDTWNTLLTSLTFGLYRSEKVDVIIEATDELSGVKTVDYYVVDGVDATTLLTKDDLRALSDSAWISYAPFSVPTDKMVVVYARVADNAGNIAYFCSDGLIVEESAASIELNLSDPAADNGDPSVYGYYNDDVTVGIKVTDAAPYSGIKKIEYWVTSDNVETQRQTLYSFGYDGDYKNKAQSWEIIDVNNPSTEQHTGIPTYDMLKNTWTGNITIDANKNNSCNVVLTVEVTDNAGNVSEQVRNLDIDVTPPTISVSYDDNTPANGKYFAGTRTATIVITERSHHFDSATATNGITITAKDADGKAVTIDPATMISSWTEKIGSTADATTYTATITYSVDANYTFAIEYTDKATNKNTTVNTGSSAVPYEFTVDAAKPTGSASIGTNVWDKLLETLTFGLYSNEKFDVAASANDVTSPLKIEYYKVSGEKAPTVLKATDLDAITTWSLLVNNGENTIKDLHTLTVSDDEQFVVYFKITDYAGNYIYVCTDGAIVEDTPAVVDEPAPEITIEPEQPINGLYNGDVKVDIKVTDPLYGETYSGLKSVSYKVFNMGEVTQEGILYSFTETAPTSDKLLQTWTGSITVDSKLNNSNDVKIEVYAQDNALNASSNSANIKIDITAPKIDFRYDNDNLDSGTYYNANRTATIVVTERNFKSEDVIVTITNTDGTIPTISSWTSKEGTGNGDDTTYTATISYAADGDYTFAIEYTDLANNKCAEINSTSTNPYAFTIDKTAPTISVAYNNNAVANEKYFNAVRTATVTIVEHNFNVDRVIFTRNTARGGQLPNITWTNNGDTHVATISYTADGDYTFDVTMTDMAGNASGAANYGNSAAGKDFVIDTTFEDMISISGVENGVAYGHDADVIPNIKISDINLNGYTVALVGVQKDKTIDLTEEVNKLLDAGSETVTGIFDIFEAKQDLDGIYTLTLTSEDKAGNKDSEEIVFTVNRFGSVYVYSQYLLDLIADGGSYVISVDEDLVIDEYNADRLLADSLKIEITVDGRPLENVKYTVTPEINDTVAVGESGWFQYKYTISKDNFADDGVYKISISSKDATGNKPENNNYEGMEMSFRVDSTKPEITSIVGLEESIINAQEVTVKYTVFDTIGLKSIKVYVNGELVDEITDFSADMNNFSGQFTLLEQSNAQSVKIIAEDMSGNITDTSSEDFTSAYAFNDSVTVSTNAFVRWYANKPLFWGSIVGVVAVAGGLGAFIAAKRKKKEKAEAK